MLSHDCLFHKHQISMNVRIQVQVYCVMRMLTAMTLMAVIYAGVELATQGMDLIVLVSANLNALMWLLTCTDIYRY